MAASKQKKWLTAPKGRLAEADLPAILASDAAWACLPRERRIQLYDLLPPPNAGEGPYDIDIHPLQTPLKPYIEDGLQLWQQDLKDGKERKAWRKRAVLAGKQRDAGKWEEWKKSDEEELFGKPSTEPDSCERKSMETMEAGASPEAEDDDGDDVEDADVEDADDVEENDEKENVKGEDDEDEGKEKGVKGEKFNGESVEGKRDDADRERHAV